ncbi:MAG TPA: ABC transporter permease, partial [Acidimicrobiia bacterium]|nr:ABC transporter permease [Acidimicrobiia bacterium]
LTDIGIAQSPMFHSAPPRWATLLPGYGASRLMYEGAFATAFHASSALALSAAWLCAVGLAVYTVLRRSVAAQP